jgi:AraC-like DNA-binding protein
MSKHKMPVSRLLFNDNSPCDTGRLTGAGILSQQRQSGFRKMRVLGSYALVCLTAGGGYYRDVNGVSRDVHAGNAIVIFPEIAHRYGPRQGGEWSEIYVMFDGAIFDQLRKSTFLDDRYPVLKMPAAFAEQLQELLEMPRPLGAAQRLEEIGKFLELLGRLYRTNEANSTFEAVSGERWLPLARRALEANLERPVDWGNLARQCGMSYESFRKKFRAATGNSPSRYRDECRIQAACNMLIQHPQLTLRQVAHSLGFYDEFAFSKRFKQVKNCSPREFRKGGR